MLQKDNFEQNSTRHAHDCPTIVHDSYSGYATALVIRDFGKITYLHNNIKNHALIL